MRSHMQKGGIVLFYVEIDPKDFGYADMHRIMSNGRQAPLFALMYRDVLENRETVYTLYGPHTHHLGVLAAGHLSSSKLRKLEKRTRRKHYIRYEFDRDKNLIRIVKVYNNVERSVYHMFWVDHVLYGCTIPKNGYGHPNENAYLVQFKDGRPQYFALSKSNYLCIDLYEYPEPDRVKTTCYLYLPASKFCSTGLKASWESPMGAQDSPVTLDYRDEEYHHIDFKDYLSE